MVIHFQHLYCRFTCKDTNPVPMYFMLSLTPPTSNLPASNTCAKCRLTFRMTSDLGTSVFFNQCQSLNICVFMYLWTRLACFYIFELKRIFLSLQCSTCGATTAEERAAALRRSEAQTDCVARFLNHVYMIV